MGTRTNLYRNMMMRREASRLRVIAATWLVVGWCAAAVARESNVIAESR